MPVDGRLFGMQKKESGFMRTMASFLIMMTGDRVNDVGDPPQKKVTMPVSVRFQE